MTTSTTPADPFLGQLVAGRFRIEELIGQGGMGKVYRARHLALDRPVCLKVLKTALLEDPTLVGRFEREAKAASRLNHPNVIQVLDFGRNEPDGSLFIAMEYVQGKDLRQVLRDEWPLPEERLCRILAQALDALGEAHAHNVIHRDLKPENIMVEQRRDRSDVVKVLDFGIAKILDPDLPGLTRNDVVCGTPQYMAPEQATGTQLDARCDVYAIGVILYQMATGYLPFDGQNSMEVLTRHVHEPPVPPRVRRPDAGISAELEAVILHALRKDPEARPQTAAELRDLLLEIERARELARRVDTPASIPTDPLLPRVADDPSAPPPGAAHAPAARARRRRVLALAATGAILVGVLALQASHRARQAGARPLAPVAAGPSEGGAEKARALVRRAAGTNDPRTARELLERAVALDPANAEAHYRLGELLLQTDRDGARRELEAARRLEPARYRGPVETLLKAL